MESKLEKEIGLEAISEGNIRIGKFLGFQPEIEYCVGNEDSYCYSPERCCFNYAESQKAECDRWLKENKERFPDGWITKENYKTVKLEHYPPFHRDFNRLMEAVILLDEKGIKILLSAEIDVLWKRVEKNCK